MVPFLVLPLLARVLASSPMFRLHRIATKGTLNKWYVPRPSSCQPKNDSPQEPIATAPSVKNTRGRPPCKSVPTPPDFNRRMASLWISEIALPRCEWLIRTDPDPSIGTQGTNTPGGRRSIRVQRRSAAVLDNNQQLAEKILTATLSAAAKAAKHRRIPSMTISIL